MRILAIGAHPDDIEYGCGGYLLLAAKKKHEVYLAVMTNGSGTGHRGRMREQEKAAKLLHARKLFWGGFRDTELEFGRELIMAIEDVVRLVSPDMVLVNSPQDAHQDHAALSNCTVTACRYVKRVLFYHDYTTLNFQPSTFVDISPVLVQKKRLLACHASQVRKKYPTGLDMLESVSALAAYYGFMAKVKYAEAFQPLRNLLTV